MHRLPRQIPDPCLSAALIVRLALASFPAASQLPRLPLARGGGNRPTLIERSDILASIHVIIVNYRTPDLAAEGAQSALAEANEATPIGVTIVDGGSGDGSAERLAAWLAKTGDARVRLLPLAVNGGFAFANNRAMMALAQVGPLPDYIMLLNPDARARPAAIATLAALLDATPRAGAVGALLEHEDGRPQSSAFIFPSLRGEFAEGAKTRLIERLIRQPPIAIESDSAREVPWVTGAAVMFRTTALRETGLMDEGFFLYFEETELMRRLHTHGWTVWHEPAARVVHLGGVATGIRDPETGLAARRPVPRYWLDSRRRFFALAGGRPYAFGTGLSWLAGRMVWVARSLVSRREDVAPPGITGDFVASGLWPKIYDATPAVPSFDGPVSDYPAWMTRTG